MTQEIELTNDGSDLVLTMALLSGGGAKRVFVDRRAGIVWGEPGGDGYACIVGREAVRSVHDEDMAIWLLDEINWEDYAKGVQHIISLMFKWSATVAYADCSKEKEAYLEDFARYFLKKRYTKKIIIDDCHDWASIKSAWPRMSLLGTKNLIHIPAETILHRQMGRMDLADIDGKANENAWPAVEAFSNVICSYKISPGIIGKKINKPAKTQEGYK